MDLDRLREFTVLAERGSLHDAALALGISPATLSARLHAFEDSLNAHLVSVQGKSLRLTKEGQSLLVHARDILRAYQSLTEAVAVASRHTAHRLRLALPESSLPLFLGPFLDRINRSWPSVRIELVDGSRLPLAQSLLSGGVDLIFALRMDSGAPEGLVRHDIAQPFHHVLLPRNHRLSQRSSLTLSDLSDECFILSPDVGEADMRSFQLANLAASGIRFKTYDSGTDAAFTKLLVPIGKGILLLACPVPDLPPNTVSISVLDLPRPATPCVFACRQSGNPDVSEFLTDYMAFCRGSLRASAGQGGTTA